MKHFLVFLLLFIGIGSVTAQNADVYKRQDQKFLYSYPRQRERQLDSLLSILSIAPNKLLGPVSYTHLTKGRF